MPLKTLIHSNRQTEYLTPKAEPPRADAVPEQSAPEQEPAPQAAPPEPEEERCPFAQPDWKPTTALDHQAVDLVHQLESLMTV